MSASRKNEALHLFFDGVSLRKIAEQIGVHRSTVERWSAQEQWVEKRRLSWQKAQEDWIRSNICTHKGRINQAYDSVHTLLIEALAERRLYCEGKKGQRGLRISNRMFLNIAKAYAELEAGFIRNLAHKDRSD